MNKQRHFEVCSRLHGTDVDLEQLADYLLMDELKDKTPNKIRLVTEPILSASQLKLRQLHEYLVADMDTFHR